MNRQHLTNADAATTEQPAEPAADTATHSQRDQEHPAALKKCEALTGADKTTCVDVAGQM